MTDARPPTTPPPAAGHAGCCAHARAKAFREAANKADSYAATAKFAWRENAVGMDYVFSRFNALAEKLRAMADDAETL